MNDVDRAFLEAENTRLQQRVAELEDLLARTRQSAVPATADETLRRELPKKLADETESLGRAATFAFLEQLRSVADTFKAVADEALRREELHNAQLEAAQFSPGRVALERLAEVPSDLSACLTTAMDSVVRMPRRVLEKFFHYYGNPARGHKPHAADSGTLSQRSAL
jgi:hypothetical protein